MTTLATRALASRPVLERSWGCAASVEAMGASRVLARAESNESSGATASWSVVRARNTPSVLRITQGGARRARWREDVASLFAVLCVGAHQRHQILHRCVPADRARAYVSLHRFWQFAHQRQPPAHPALAPIETPCQLHLCRALPSTAEHRVNSRERRSASAWRATPLYSTQPG